MIRIKIFAFRISDTFHTPYDEGYRARPRDGRLGGIQPLKNVVHSLLKDEAGIDCAKEVDSSLAREVCDLEEQLDVVDSGVGPGWGLRWRARSDGKRRLLCCPGRAGR